ncbi:hypothetical protein CW706_01310 [Candidatus Bathyarchaeota archaeon]|nr:MAG: hypothetical protein CW706_01310 [Candidatus Bathyarchaeota archaeon]
MINEIFDLKVRIKPVLPLLVHSGTYEGPCRVGDEKTLDPEFERSHAREVLKEFCENIKLNISSDGELLDPEIIEWGEDFVIPREEMKKLDRDAENVDLFLIAPSGLTQYPSIAIARRYRKPIAKMGQISSVDISAYLRSQGMEGYALIDHDELNTLISLLKVRKSLCQTRVLVVSEGNMLPVGVVSNVWNLEDVKGRFGIDYKCVSSNEVFEEMDAVLQDESELKKAEELTDKLIEGAEKVHMKREFILQSVIFYIAIRNLMKKYRCNSFVIPCFELCVKRIPAEKKVTFCLAHSLLKDEGYPSACEGDFNSLLTMIILMYLSKKSAYMGNSYLISKEDNLIAVHHDVPGLKMKGLKESSLPYEIRNFTVKGWGATIRYDFSNDKGETVTLARFNPTATKMLVAKGEIAGCGGFDEIGCSLRAEIKVSDAVKLFHKEREFGHHLVMVYGDYTEKLKALGEILGFEVVEA